MATAVDVDGPWRFITLHRKAFTLIELLVVIAIIAILAAILFPVFAQAKVAAKKTTTLSNCKQMGTAFQIYLSDNDDSFPLAFSRRADGTWRWATVHPTPAGVVNTGGWDAPLIVEQTKASWANSLYPYVKSWPLYDAAGTQEFSYDATFTPGITPAKTTLTMNGLFHKLNASSVEAPSIAVLAWPGSGRASVKGRSFANPSLNCGSATDDCHFRPGAAASSAGFGGALFTNPGDLSAWLYDKSIPMVRTDSSAKSVQIGLMIQPNFHQWPNILSDPFAAVTPTGQPRSYWPCGTGHTPSNPRWDTVNYPCYFRPDRTL